MGSGMPVLSTVSTVSTDSTVAALSTLVRSFLFLAIGLILCYRIREYVLVDINTSYSICFEYFENRCLFLVDIMNTLF